MQPHGVATLLHFSIQSLELGPWKDCRSFVPAWSVLCMVTSPTWNAHPVLSDCCR